MGTARAVVPAIWSRRIIALGAYWMQASDRLWVSCEAAAVDSHRILTIFIFPKTTFHQRSGLLCDEPHD
jgi:hypothetical protein